MGITVAVRKNGLENMSHNGRSKRVNLLITLHPRHLKYITSYLSTGTCWLPLVNPHSTH